MTEKSCPRLFLSSQIHDKCLQTPFRLLCRRYCGRRCLLLAAMSVLLEMRTGSIALPLYNTPRPETQPACQLAGCKARRAPSSIALLPPFSSLPRPVTPASQRHLLPSASRLFLGADDSHNWRHVGFWREADEFDQSIKEGRGGLLSDHNICTEQYKVDPNEDTRVRT